MVEQRLHTYRTNWTLLLLIQTITSETGDYTGVDALCQAYMSHGFTRINAIRIHLCKSVAKQST